ncbi:hypothetical protein VFPFJ_08756 [Purpureocillium lilacinum]|uniref:Uncharacterized protein n=1 Tax=Purpureocillium lilacinum TaxID=33203 RepID=A0A179GAJ5_PURLI|nr:hypothetical protein VFPFJ_08756 [Purpureocillium lilacinum]OAQ74842.1 hypothetical protein VFPBJ_10137 [Purpureocillium lilacinum]OAQ82953.1 hypothetical protein VFPFJ_08756 [Purpureocillium lilacinum]
MCMYEHLLFLCVSVYVDLTRRVDNAIKRRVERSLQVWQTAFTGLLVASSDHMPPSGVQRSSTIRCSHRHRPQPT